MEEKLQELHQTEIEILNVIDAVCKKNDLKYSLCAGTLLGAVRHRGFIPWDDDLDVCMSRRNYEKFLKAWDTEEHPGYLLQNKGNAPEFTQSFSKIRKDHTVFLEHDYEAGKFHNGIFVDIFPIDRMPRIGWKRNLYCFACMYFHLLTREHTPPESSALVRCCSWLLLTCTPKAARPAIRAYLEKKLTQYNDDHTLETVCATTIPELKLLFPPELLDDYTLLSFEGGMYPCFSMWDEYLKREYGDYMCLPPEEDRVWKHHPVVIDFTHNLDEMEDIKLK